MRREKEWRGIDRLGLVPKRKGIVRNGFVSKRKGIARNCQAPNWNSKETKRFVVQREGKAMISLEKLWNSNDKFREALE